ncbi:MAG: Na+/H+ antiporter subunit D [Rhodobacteraceae bacterium]|nr:Na+/H+ antiporter subunit D [Paracoccaceae bacterium]
MSWILALPLLIPFVTAIAVFLLSNSPKMSARVSLAGSLAGLVAALFLFAEVASTGVVAGQMGGWPAPFGITLVADMLSAIMVVITAITAVAVALYALGEIGAEQSRLGYHALFQVLIGGVSGAFLTGDLFNLYVWFEVMLISSFGLLILGGRPEQIDGAVKYVALNLVSTILFLSGIGLLYGETGTLNMADLSRVVAEHPDQGMMTLIALLFMIAFGVKSAVFPLFFWLPASYHTPGFAVSAVFAGLLTKVGVYSLIRAFTLIFVSQPEVTHTILLWVAGFTMVTGVLGAAAQSEFRRILSFHIVSQIGYMVLGLALFTPLALVGSVFYLVHHIIVKANLFLISGISQRMTGSGELYRIGGLYAAAPLLAALFLIPAFSLAGFPPLSGFWAKYVLVKASLDADAWIIAGVALLVGLLTIYSMTKIWAEAFWKDDPSGRIPKAPQDGPPLWPCYAAVVFLAVLTICVGLVPGPFLAFAETAATQLLSSDAYINAVLGAQE